MKNLGSGSTPSLWFLGIFASTPLPAKYGDDQSDCKSQEQMALGKVERLTFDDIFAFVGHFDVATGKGQEQQVRKKARCFLRTPQMAVCVMSMMSREHIFPISQENHSSGNFCFMMFN